MSDTESLAKQWGFIGYPFREPVAERESNRERFFVQPPYFREILGDLKKPSSTFVFGYRGDGKSSLRLAVQSDLEVAEPKYLVVDYTSFTSFTAEEAKAATVETHFEVIFRSVIDRLLSDASANQSLLGKLNSEELGRFHWLALRYPPKGDWRSAERRLIDVLAKGGEQKQIKRLGLRGFRHVVSYLRQKRQELNRRAAAGDRGMVADIVSTALTLIAPDTPASAGLAEKDLDGLLTEVITLVRKVGFAGIVVLVDRVDEAPSFGSDPRVASDFIRPLATALTILEADGFAVKFFLPWEIYERIRTQIRTDRLRWKVIEWQEPALRELLRRRLLAFSVEQVQSLDEHVHPTIRDTFHEAITHYSAENPRNLLRLLDSILTEVADADETMITERTARLGIDKFVSMRRNESDGDAYAARLRKRGQPPRWTLGVS